MLSAGSTARRPVALQPHERRACSRIACFVMLQCAAVFAGAATVYGCVWAPGRSAGDYDKLARIMYLYDSDACGHRVRAALAISNLRLDNRTRGFDVLPVRWQPAVVTVSARFSAATRWYLNFSMAVHVAWLVAAALLRLVVAQELGEGPLKVMLALFLYVSIGVVVFDLSMGIVYASHIKKSLTKGMILRYSGWSVEMKLQNYSDFGGWVPMAAAACWLRGGVLLLLNVYCCRALLLVARALRRQEVKRRLTLTENRPLPDARPSFPGAPSRPAVLYYRAGEHTPAPLPPPGPPGTP
ncbi:uncharacterized protein [Battus philenor]|uniref:uncharacterized protein n=1 Tax=Battus philenor TaxID=42288 RepID=UPI0035CF90C2